MAWKTKPPYNIPVNPAHPLASGLQGCWLFNEGEGLTANDISGNVNTGTITGASWTTGNGGNSALVFNAITDSVDVGAAITNLTAKSVFMWLKPTAFTGSYRGVYDGKYHYSPFGDVMFLTNTVNTIQIYLKNTAAQLSYHGGISYTPNTWVHVGYSWTGTVTKFYKNGVRTAGTGETFTGTLASSAANTLIGRIVAYPNPLAGNIIADVRIWNRGLTPAEVLSLYNDPYDMFLDPQVNFLRGTATVSQGNTTATVTHGLGFVPSLVWLQPLSDSGKKWFITGRTATQFTINLPAAAQADVSYNYGVA